MKKAFDANVSRAKPRLRLGSMMSSTTEVTEAPASDAMTMATVEALAQQVAGEASVIPDVTRPTNVDLGSALKARAQARATKGTAAEALQEALARETSPASMDARAMDARAMDVRPTQAQAFDARVAPAAAQEDVRALRPSESTHGEVPRAFQVTERADAGHFVNERPVSVQADASARSVSVSAVESAPRATVTVHAGGEPRPEWTEVQTAPPPAMEPDADERRERLRERLKAVRENPRPEPLPDTVAEAGVLAVERIAALQTELTKSRAMNLALAQDLEAARRQAERATEEARMRMDEARRLAKEMEGRVTLLSELERELEALEGERNESLLALQESRQILEVREREKLELGELVAKKDQEISDSLAEEERLADELEQAQEAMMGLRRSSDALKGERDTLARQVSELTRERAELLEARKALEAVHRALSTAARR